MKGIVSAAVVSLAIAASPVFAQTPTPRVDKREAKQQARIQETQPTNAMSSPLQYVPVLLVS